jgi:hypothetical protein
MLNEGLREPPRRDVSRRCQQAFSKQTGTALNTNQTVDVIFTVNAVILLII